MCNVHDIIFYSFRYSKSVEDFRTGSSEVMAIWGFNESAGDAILNSLEVVYLGEIYRFSKGKNYMYKSLV